MGKKQNKKQFPTVEKMGELGFQDGYTGKKSRENEFISMLSKKNKNQELVKARILAYSLGYKKGQLFSTNELNSFTIINGEIALNGKLICLNEKAISSVNEKISELYNKKIKTKRR